ncbi:MAG: DNA repair protein RecO [Solirubrobacterales bacterium]
MPGYYKTEAVVLRSMRLREADRIVHLYTRSRGQVGAVVKGVRRTRSRFGGRLEPFMRLRLVMYAGRGDLDTITQAEALEWHPKLRTRGASLHMAGLACESVLRLFSDGESNEAAYNLLCRELQLLDAHEDVAGAANLLAFRLKLLLAAGFVPELSECVWCGADVAEAGVAGFSSAAGGVLCRACPRGDCMALDERSRSFMAAALAAQLKDTPESNPSMLSQVDRAVTGTLEHHAHVSLRSVA